MMKRQALLVATLVGMTMTPAMAEMAGSWTAGIGVGVVDPKGDNGTLSNGLEVEVDSNTRPTLTAEYFVQDNIGVEVLAAWPFKHDIDLKNPTNGAMVKAETKHLPPTVSVQYHFDDMGAWSNLGFGMKPFLGVGVNYTNFFDEEIALPGAELDLDDSWGMAGHAGLDFAFNNTDSIRLDVRYIDIDTDVELRQADGVKVKLGSADIDPWVYGASYVRRF